MEGKQKGDDWPGSHAVGDRVGDKRIDALQENREADYSSFQTTAVGEEHLSERNKQKQSENFDEKGGYVSASVNPLDRGDDNTLKSQ